MALLAISGFLDITELESLVEQSSPVALPKQQVLNHILSIAHHSSLITHHQSSPIALPKQQVLNYIPFTAHHSSLHHSSFIINQVLWLFLSSRP
jgi:hypothetical protein